MHNDFLMEISRLSAKGQTTIPKQIREIIGIEPGDMVAYITDGKNEVRLVSASSAADKINHFQVN